jgi:hypothetical protein
VSDHLLTAGECLSLSSSLGWVSELIAEGTGGDLRSGEAADASVSVHVEADRQPFETEGWQLLARGAWRRRGEVVLENACTSGFDLHLSCGDGPPEFTYRWRPPARDRAAARVLRSRFHLLARATLLQDPALWLAGTRGRAPLHASGCASARSIALVTAQSGVGRSTLVLAETLVGGLTTGDNLAVGDGTSLWGLVEPARVTGGSGRRMPHGRQETDLSNRVPALEPDCVVVLVRGDGEAPALTRCAPEAAASALVASTYMAGELRRYWSFAAALAAGTGVGSPHPPVVQVAATFAEKLPCFSLALGRVPGACLGELLETSAVAA